jgi:putative membrane protein
VAVKISFYVGGLLGLALLICIAVHSDVSGMVHVLEVGGFSLLWIIPYRAFFFLLYAIGWIALLHPNEAANRVGLGYFFWATAVRDAVDRLLPVASVGGSLVGVRILRWRGIAGAPAAASVIVEIFLTLVAVYLFTALGLMLLAQYGAHGHEFRRVLTAFLIGLPVPVIVLVLLRSGSVLLGLKSFLLAIAGESVASKGADSLDREIRASLRRPRGLLVAGVLQLVALCSGSLEIWFALRLFEHPIGIDAALMLESMIQAVRHIAFVVPAGLGVQEGGLIIIGHVIGIDSDTALAVAMLKRMREVIWGVPFLLSWQWVEGRKLKALGPR